MHLLLGTLLALTAGITVASTLDWGANVPLPMLLAFIIWPMVPMVVATAGGWFMRSSGPARVSCFLGLLATFGLLAFCYVYAFHLKPDPQGGLILIFGPIYALAALAPFGLAALILFARRRPPSLPAQSSAA